jgi:hypothetical protein
MWGDRYAVEFLTCNVHLARYMTQATDACYYQFCSMHRRRAYDYARSPNAVANVTVPTGIRIAERHRARCASVTHRPFAACSWRPSG